MADYSGYGKKFGKSGILSGFDACRAVPLLRIMRLFKALPDFGKEVTIQMAPLKIDLVFITRVICYLGIGFLNLQNGTTFT